MLQKKAHCVGLIVGVLIIELIFFLTPTPYFADASDTNKALIEAARKGDLETVIRFLERGADINYEEKCGVRLTPLMAGVQSGHTELVRLLVDKGAEINL